MIVQLARITNSPVELIYTAYRTCYSALPPSEIEIPDYDTMVKFIEDKIRLGHESPLEHVSVTFFLEGVSRTLLAQLTRHRLASYSVQSQRYVKAENFGVIHPKSIVENSTEARSVYADAIRNARQAYADLIDLGVPKEDARMVLMEGTTCNIVFTTNLRSFRHILAERAFNPAAQWEIREAACAMCDGVKPFIPFVDYGLKEEEGNE